MSWPDAIVEATGRLPGVAVAVSGGADSVAALLAIHELRPASLKAVVHVDHATRPGSAEDADFVARVAGSLGVETVVRGIDAPATEAGWRRARLGVFAEVVGAAGLAGVVLGHQADDVAETLALRLLRGSARSGTLGLRPLREDATVAGVRLFRPMLRASRADLRAALLARAQTWREDPSNAEPNNLRSRVRRLMAASPGLRAALLRLGDAADEAEARLAGLVEAWPDVPSVTSRDGADPLSRRAARRWLRRAGVAERDASPDAVDRLLAVLSPDGPRVAMLPGGVRVRRRGRSAGGGVEVTRPARS